MRFDFQRRCLFAGRNLLRAMWYGNRQRRHVSKAASISREKRVNAFEVSSLESRVMLSSTIFLDFGAGIGMGNSFTTDVRSFRNIFGAGARGNGTGSNLSGRAGLDNDSPLTFTPFAYDFDGNGTTDTADIVALSDAVVPIVERAMEPFDIDVVVGTASSLADAVTAVAANNGDPTGEFDAYNFIMEVTSADINDGVDSFATSLGEQLSTWASSLAPDDPFWAVADYEPTSKSDLSTAATSSADGSVGQAGGLFGIAAAEDLFRQAGNNHDEATLTFTDVVFRATSGVEGTPAFNENFATRLAYTAAHEAFHTFTYVHTTGTTTNTRLLSSGDVIRLGSVTREDPFMVTRFDLGRQNNFNVAEPNNYLQAANDSDIGLRDDNNNGTPDFAFVSGTGAHDRITLTAGGGSIVNVRVEAFANDAFTIPVQTETYTIDLATETEGEILIDGGINSDQIRIDSSIDADFRIRGGTGRDGGNALDSIGFIGSVSAFTFNATTGSGTATFLNARNVIFNEIESLFSSMISGVVFDDLDRDGERDPGEAGLDQVAVYIDTNNDGIRQATEALQLTDPNGVYTFSSVPPGTNNVRVIPPGSRVQTTQGGPGNAEILTIAPGENRVGVNFGLAVAAPQLTLTIADDSISETDGVAATTATVIRNTDPTESLTVTLMSDDTSEATVIGSVTILAGQTAATFDIDAVDDNIEDGTQVVTFTATADNHANGTDTLNVTDANEQPIIDDVTFELVENSADATVVGSVTASDPNSADTLSYAITGGNGTGSGAFAIDQDGVITVADSAQIDFETTPTFSLTLEVRDGGVPEESDTATVTINLTNVNDNSPLFSGLPLSITDTLNEGPLQIASSIVVSDADSPSFNTARLRIYLLRTNRLASDHLQFASTDSVTADNRDGSAVIVDGVRIGTVTALVGAGTRIDIRLNAQATQERITSLLRTLEFDTTEGGEERTVRFELDDGEGLRGTAELGVSLTAKPPVLNDLPALLTDTLNNAPLRVAPAASITDADSLDFNTGLARVYLLRTNRLTTDHLQFASTDRVFTQNLAQSPIFVDGIRIGTIIESVGGGTRIDIRFNGQATPDRVTALLRALEFDTSEGGEQRTVRVEISDGDGLRVTGEVGVTVTSRPPVLSGLPSSINEVLDSAPVSVASSGVVTDADSPNFASGLLRVAILGENRRPTDHLQFSSSSRVVAGSLPGEAILVDGIHVGTIIEVVGVGTRLDVRLNGEATDDRVTAILQTLQFDTSDAGGRRVVRIDLSDGDGERTIEHVAVSITAEPPRLTNIPQRVAANTANAPLLIAPEAIVTDIDSRDFNKGLLRVALLATNRRETDHLQFATTDRVSVGQDDGSPALVDGVQIGTVIASVGFGTRIEIRLNAQATADRVSALLQAVEFDTIQSSGERIARFTIEDGDGQSDVASIAIAVSAAVPIEDTPASGPATIALAGTLRDDDEIGIVDAIFAAGYDVSFD